MPRSHRTFVPRPICDQAKYLMSGETTQESDERPHREKKVHGRAGERDHERVIAWTGASAAGLSVRAPR